MKKIIKENNILIRNLEEQDKTLLLKWLTDKRVLNFWEGQSSVFNLDRIKEDFYNKEKVTRTIIEFQNMPIGYCQFYKLNKDDLNEYKYSKTNKTVYGVDQFIGDPNYWGKGIGTTFMKLILEYLTTKKNADVVILDPHTDNLRAIRCYQKVGFKKIKTLLEHELHDGKMVDCYLMEYTKQF